MATRSPAGLTLVEVAKRLAPDGSQARIAEVLAEKNDILNDIPFRAANDTFVNKTIRRSQEPAGPLFPYRRAVRKQPHGDRTWFR